MQSTDNRNARTAEALAVCVLQRSWLCAFSKYQPTDSMTIKKTISANVISLKLLQIANRTNHMFRQITPGVASYVYQSLQ